MDGTSQAGDCTTTLGTNLDTSLSGQRTQINSLSSLLADFPCTPIAGGVQSNNGNLNCGAAKCTSPVSYVIVPTTGTATLTIPVSVLANGMNASKFTLYWFSETGTTGIPLKKCSDTQGAGYARYGHLYSVTDRCEDRERQVHLGRPEGLRNDPDRLEVRGLSLLRN